MERCLEAINAIESIYKNIPKKKQKDVRDEYQCLKAGAEKMSYTRLVDAIGRFAIKCYN